MGCLHKDGICSGDSRTDTRMLCLMEQAAGKRRAAEAYPREELGSSMWVTGLKGWEDEWSWIPLAAADGETIKALELHLNG